MKWDDARIERYVSQVFEALGSVRYLSVAEGMLKYMRDEYEEELVGLRGEKAKLGRKYELLFVAYRLEQGYRKDDEYFWEGY